MVEQKRKRRLPLWLRILRAMGMLVVVIIAIGVIMVTFFPDVAAQNVDRLRNIIGDERVAQLETFVLNVQDQAQQLAYSLGLSNPKVPWSPTLTDSTAIAALISPTPNSLQTLHGLLADPVTNTPPSLTQLATSGTNVGTPTAVPVLKGTPSPTVTVAWQLSALTPFGKLPGEGQWLPYMQSANGKNVVAYRTYLQPDPQRLYTLPAIVAFNLDVTRLHFMLGTIDPVPATPQPSRTGTIPDIYMQPGVLLATFNGGFKARHGHYGAMSDGLVALPAIDGDATVAIYKDGSVKIGMWGTDIKDSPDLVGWRQNGKVLIRNGQINPETAQKNIPWGATIQGDVITWRSALGLSADGRTLYYIGGPHLDVPTLTKAMAQTGAANALELDVNDFWVNFAAIRSSGGKLTAEPLIGEMTQKVDRYLKVSTDDFFYVTQ